MRLPAHTPTTPFQSKEFKELRDEWYEKLSQSGFEDIEVKDPKSDRVSLKSWHSHYFQSPAHGFKDSTIFKLKADYYYYANQFTDRHTFETTELKEMWKMHTAGIGIRDIGKKLGLTRDKTWRLLKDLKESLRHFVLSSGEDLLDKKDVLTIRPKSQDDEAFIYSTWLENLLANMRWRTTPTRKQFFKYHDVVEHILKKPNTTVQVACLKEAPDVIVGYSVFEKTARDTILHWIFVRADWQKQGIARDLCPPNITVVTHLTKIGERIWKRQSVRPKYISLPLSYEILETTSQL